MSIGLRISIVFSKALAVTCTEWIIKKTKPHDFCFFSSGWTAHCSHSVRVLSHRMVRDAQRFYQKSKQNEREIRYTASMALISSWARVTRTACVAHCFSSLWFCGPNFLSMLLGFFFACIFYHSTLQTISNLPRLFGFMTKFWYRFHAIEIMMRMCGILAKQKLISFNDEKRARNQ